MMFVLVTKRPTFYHPQDGLMACLLITYKKVKKGKYLKNNQAFSPSISNTKKITVFTERTQPSSDQ